MKLSRALLLLPVGAFALVLAVRAPREAARVARASRVAPSPNAYGHALANLAPERWPEVRDGKAIFVATWVAADQLEAARASRGAAAHLRAGLGADFNATSCAGCHFRDGRGAPPAGDRAPSLIRIGAPGSDGQLVGDPRYGVQLQDRAAGVPEARVDVFHVPVIAAPFAVLRAPQLVIHHLRAGALASETRTSLRIPPSLIGLGLLEAVAAASLEAFADPDDADHDGISGRVAYVRDPRTGDRVVGRFGWKASQPSLWLQNATALREDLGVTSSVLPCASPCQRGIADRDLELLTRYTRLLEPPVRRDADDPMVMRGEAVFASAGCAACHRPALVTGDVADLPELSRRAIAPYSDLLLHDLGDALADGRPEGGATGREWRTQPLWGLGLLANVSGEVRLLHDGRARSPEEAIRWHGGEAAASRARFVALARGDRDALLRFLDSL